MPIKNSRLKTSVAIIGIAALAGVGATNVLPMASAQADTGVQLAACKPCRGCNPCKAKKRGCGGCNPCKAKKHGCGGCNPCKAKKHGCGGCNPCKAKKKY